MGWVVTDTTAAAEQQSWLLYPAGPHRVELLEAVFLVSAWLAICLERLQWRASLLLLNST